MAESVPKKTLTQEELQLMEELLNQYCEKSKLSPANLKLKEEFKNEVKEKFQSEDASELVCGFLQQKVENGQNIENYFRAFTQLFSKPEIERTAYLPFYCFFDEYRKTNDVNRTWSKITIYQQEIANRIEEIKFLFADGITKKIRDVIEGKQRISSERLADNLTAIPQESAELKRVKDDLRKCTKREEQLKKDRNELEYQVEALRKRVNELKSEHKKAEDEKADTLHNMLLSAPEGPSPEWEAALDKRVQNELHGSTAKICGELEDLMLENCRNGVRALLDSVRRNDRGGVPVMTGIVNYFIKEKDDIGLQFLYQYAAESIVKSENGEASEWKSFIQNLLPLDRRNPLFQFLSNMLCEISEEGAQLWGAYQNTEKAVQGQQRELVLAFREPLGELEGKLSDIRVQLQSGEAPVTEESLKNLAEKVKAVHEAFEKFGIQSMEDNWESWLSLKAVPFAGERHKKEGGDPEKGTLVRLRSMGFQNVGDVFNKASVTTWVEKPPAVQQENPEKKGEQT